MKIPSICHLKRPGLNITWNSGLRIL